jgi:hypothetical protein
MRHSLRLMALALAVAATALLAPVAHAEGPPLPTLPTKPPMLPVDQSGGTNYYYWDSDGWGSLNVKLMALGYVSGLELVNCKLYQNGHTFYGSGVSTGSYLFFTMSGYVFQVSPTGYGSYYPVGSPKNQRYFWLGAAEMMEQR